MNVPVRFGDAYATGAARKGFAFFVPNARPVGGDRTYQGNRGLQIAAQQSINLPSDFSSGPPRPWLCVRLNFSTGAVIP